MARRRKYEYNIVKDKGQPISVTVFHRGEDHVATTAHPNFGEIVSALEEDDDIDVILELFDAPTSISHRFKGLVKRLFVKTPSGKPPSPTRSSERGRRELVRRVGEKVEVRDGKVYYDGHEMHGALSETIARYMVEGNADWEPLALFLDKVMKNPNDHSREQLYDWLMHFSFKINDEGNILAYKFVRSDMKSEHAGVGIVNGVRVKGHLDNSVGNIVEMPRNMVKHDPKVGCASGLHVGTWSFVRSGGLGRKYIMVEIDPRDVVSVPTDCSWQKLRVCRYKVLEIVTSPASSRIYAGQTV